MCRFYAELMNELKSTLESMAVSSDSPPPLAGRGRGWGVKLLKMRAFYRIQPTPPPAPPLRWEGNLWCVIFWKKNEKRVCHFILTHPPYYFILLYVIYLSPL